jgi:hypothetical protein
MMPGPRIKVGPVARAMRRWLGIDTWGWDHMREKRRLRLLMKAYTAQGEAYCKLAERLNALERQAIKAQPLVLQTMESRITALEQDQTYGRDQRVPMLAERMERAEANIKRLALGGMHLCNAIEELEHEMEPRSDGVHAS